jgi:hypothetical protein
MLVQDFPELQFPVVELTCAFAQRLKPHRFWLEIAGLKACAAQKL